MSHKDKHREASRLAMQRYRARQKALKADAKGTIQPKPVISANVLPPNYGEENCLCRHCVQTKGRLKINHKAYKTRAELGVNEVNRVAMARDVDYKEANAV